MEDEFDYILSDLYCHYCYEIFKTKQSFDAHFEACRKENIIEMPKDAEGDIYFK